MTAVYLNLNRSPTNAVHWPPPPTIYLYWIIKYESFIDAVVHTLSFCGLVPFYVLPFWQ